MGRADTRDENRKENTMQAQGTKSMNGLPLDRMFETIAAIKAQPSLARFQFRARNAWIDGG